MIGFMVGLVILYFGMVHLEPLLIGFGIGFMFLSFVLETM